MTILVSFPPLLRRDEIIVGFRSTVSYVRDHKSMGTTNDESMLRIAPKFIGKKPAIDDADRILSGSCLVM